MTVVTTLLGLERVNEQVMGNAKAETLNFFPLEYNYNFYKFNFFYN